MAGEGADGARMFERERRGPRRGLRESGIGKGCRQIHRVLDAPGGTGGTEGHHGSASGGRGAGAAPPSQPTGQFTDQSTGQSTALARQPDTALARFPTFDHVIELIHANRDGVLNVEVKDHVRLVSYQPGRIEFEPAPGAPADLAQRLGAALQRWTGNRWAVSVVSSGGSPSITEAETAEFDTLKTQAAAHPLVQAVLGAFPGARITHIRTQEDQAAEARADALPEVDEEWDPFEED